MLENANAIASAKSVRKASDGDFMACDDAICLIRRIHDGLYLDNPDILYKMKQLYPEFARRIDSMKDAREAIPLVKSFHRFIYGTSFIRR